LNRLTFLLVAGAAALVLIAVVVGFIVFFVLKKRRAREFHSHGRTGVELELTVRGSVRGSVM